MIALTPSLALASDDGEVVVFHSVREPDERGEWVDTIVEMDEELMLRDGQKILHELKDSGGHKYYEVADVMSGRSEYQLVRYVPQIKPEEQVVAEKREQGWTDEHIATWKTDRKKQTLVQHFDPALLEWADVADDEATTCVEIGFQEDLPRAVPRRLSLPGLQTSPILELELREARLVAEEERKNALAVLQEPWVESIEASGGRVAESYSIFNGLQAFVTPAWALEHEGDLQIAKIHKCRDIKPSGNDGIEIRRSTQLKQFLDEGYNGDEASGMNGTVSDMLAVVVDKDGIDSDHYAWRRCTAPCSYPNFTNRYLGGVTYNGTSWLMSPDATSSSHANKVAGQMVASLFNGQDPNYTTDTAKKERSGMSPKAVFRYVDWNGYTASTENKLTKALEKALTYTPDVINLSAGVNTSCDVAGTHDDAVDAAYLDGTFLVAAAGNDGNTSINCVVNEPATAATAFAVADVSVAGGNLDTNYLGTNSSRGGDALDRSVIAIAAPGGRENATLADPSDTYASGGTSYSAAVVSGAAMNLKHQLKVDGLPYDKPGYLHALLQLMGDGETIDNAQTATSRAGLSTLWGGGRLKARMINNAGLDDPKRVRFFAYDIESYETATLKVNPDGSNVNQNIEAAADDLRISAFYYEPNIEDTQADMAKILVKPRNVTDNVTNNGYPGLDATTRQLFRLVPGGDKWEILLEGSDVHVSYDASDPNYNDDERRVYVISFYEDTARDDVDGPDSTIE